MFILQLNSIVEAELPLHWAQQERKVRALLRWEKEELPRRYCILISLSMWGSVTVRMNLPSDDASIIRYLGHRARLPKPPSHDRIERDAVAKDMLKLCNDLIPMH